MTKTIESTYDRFVDKVDEGRKNLTREQVDAVAQGRVWTGTQAKENGLIDDLGGLDKALEHMQELTKAKGKLVLEDATTSKSGFSMNLNFNLNGITTNNIILESMVNDYKALYDWWNDYQKESVLMLCPLSLKDIEF